MAAVGAGTSAIAIQGQDEVIASCSMQRGLRLDAIGVQPMSTRKRLSVRRGDEDGVYLLGDETIMTAGKLREYLEERAEECDSTRRNNTIFHYIRPKYCRMLGIDPDEMLASLQSELWAERLDRQIDEAFGRLDPDLPLAQRIWKAHIIGFMGSCDSALSRFIATRLLGIPVPKWRSGEYPPSAMVEKILKDPARRDALDWLNTADPGVIRSLGKGWSNADSIKIIEELKAAGAVSVIVGAANKVRGKEWTRTFLVELPVAHRKRARFIAWARRLKQDVFSVHIKEDCGEQYAFGAAAGVENTSARGNQQPMTRERWENAKLLTKKVIGKLLADPAKEDLFSWLKAGTKEAPRTLGELRSPAASLKLAMRIYRAGPKKIWAVEIQKRAGFQNTGRLVVVLPEPKAARAAVFNVVNALSAKQGFDPTPDWGQKHALITLD